MLMENASPLLNLILVLAGLLIGWTILKAVLKLTVRLFAIGCCTLFVLAAFAWVLGWIG